MSQSFVWPVLQQHSGEILPCTESTRCNNGRQDVHCGPISQGCHGRHLRFQWYGWLPVHVSFLTEVLTSEFINDRVRHAAACLQGEPECVRAMRLRDDLPNRQESIELMVEELPKVLGSFEYESRS